MLREFSCVLSLRAPTRTSRHKNATGTSNKQHYEKARSVCFVALKCCSLRRSLNNFRLQSGPISTTASQYEQCRYL